MWWDKNTELMRSKVLKSTIQFVHAMKRSACNSDLMDVYVPWCRLQFSNNADLFIEMLKTQRSVCFV